MMLFKEKLRLTQFKVGAIQEALPDKQLKTKGKLGIHLGVVDASAEIERAERPRPALPNELSLAATAFQQWVKHLNNRPGLILLDEIQHLATSSHFASFAASLRPCSIRRRKISPWFLPVRPWLICSVCLPIRKHRSLILQRSSTSPYWNVHLSITYERIVPWLDDWLRQYGLTTASIALPGA